MDSLLPRSSTPLERALESSLFKLSETRDVVQITPDGQLRLTVVCAPPRTIPTLWNPDTCPAALLPWLAWALAVEEWDPQWSEDRKRAAIRESRVIHQRKGTPWAIRRALAVCGQADAQLIERTWSVRRNGTTLRNGSVQRRGSAGWAMYSVVLHQAVTVDQALLIRRLLRSVGRNCVHLVSIDFRQASLRRNGSAIRNGAYTRGVVANQLTGDS